MKTLILCVFFSTFTAMSFAQTPGDILVGMNLDLVKSDNDGYFEKTQFGLEGNYFISEKFTATVGIEVWTRGNSSAVIGSRWYPAKNAFIRARGLFGANDFSIGGGWAKPLTEQLRFESMADFYFAGNFSIRAGLAYQIRRKK
jgi:hypothetical protein